MAEESLGLHRRGSFRIVRNVGSGSQSCGAMTCSAADGRPSCGLLAGSFEMGGLKKTATICDAFVRPVLLRPWSAASEGEGVMKNRSVPVNTVLPHVVYQDVIEASLWLARVFGFVEHYRYGEPVSGIQMRLGEASFMLTGPRDGTESPARVGRCTQMLTVIVANVGLHYERAKQQDGRVWEELHETVYGERQYGVEDLDGHRWIFSEHACDLDPADWGATVRL